MWKKFIIQDHERGLLVRDGRVSRWLAPGAHTIWTLGHEVEVRRLSIDEGVTPLTAEIECVLPEAEAEVLTVGADQLGLVSIDGASARCLGTGRYALWRSRARVTAELATVGASLHTAVPVAFWSLMDASLLRQVLVKPYQRALVYVDGVLTETLGAGRHGLDLRDRLVHVEVIDLREQELQVVGQEVMTADKVSLRVNLLARYRVADPVASVQTTDDCRNALYGEVQMATRRLIGTSTVDALLESRHEAGRRLLDEIGARAAAWGLELLRVDIKDVILPGDMKLLLNRVIEAEKQAAANLILRREETAATRSLANTARMLQDNPMLLRLKELESIKEIAGQVGQLTVVTGGGDLARLGGLIDDPRRSQ